MKASHGPFQWTCEQENWLFEIQQNDETLWLSCKQNRVVGLKSYLFISIIVVIMKLNGLNIILWIGFRRPYLNINLGQKLELHIKEGVRFQLNEVS